MARAGEGFDFLDETGDLEACYDVEVATVGRSTYVYAADEANDAIGVFSLDPDGTLAGLGSVGDTNTISLNHVTNLKSVTAHDQNYLLASGNGDNGLTIFLIRQNGTLVRRDALFDDASLELRGAFGDIKTVAFGDTTYVLTAAYDDNGVQVAEISNRGKLIARGSYDNSLDRDANLRGTTDLDVAVVGDKRFVIAAAQTDDALSVMRLGDDGSLDFVSSQVDTSALALNEVRTVASGQIGNRTFVFAGGTEDAISVFRLSNQGVLTSVTTFADTRDTRIESTRELEFKSINGKHYLFTCDSEGDAINVLRVSNNGALSASDLLRESSVNGISTFAFADLGDGPGLITSGVEQGVSSFALYPNEFGRSVMNVEDLF